MDDRQQIAFLGQQEHEKKVTKDFFILWINIYILFKFDLYFFLLTETTLNW